MTSSEAVIRRIAETKDYYEILGVDSTATQADIVKAYRKVCAQGLAVARARRFRVTARRRHDIWVQGIEQFDNGLWIIGERRHLERISRVNQQAGLAIQASLQQVRQLEFCLYQAGRCDVPGKHRLRQIKQDNQWMPVLVAITVLLLPAWTGQCHNAKG